MKKLRFLTLFAALFLLGLGGRGVEQFRSIPLPEKNFTAVVTDRSGVVTRVSLFSWEGQVYFAGYRGDGVFTVYFGKVARAEFGEPERGRVPVRLYLRDGSTFEMKMDAEKFFYGKTNIGNFRIKVSKVKLIEIEEG